jgi:hypothetical protein
MWVCMYGRLGYSGTSHMADIMDIGVSEYTAYHIMFSLFPMSLLLDIFSSEITRMLISA